MTKKKAGRSRGDRPGASAHAGGIGGVSAGDGSGGVAPAGVAPAGVAAAGVAPAGVAAAGVADVRPGDDASARGHGWTFLTNHGHVLVCLAREPELRVRDVATRVGITERAAIRIVGDLVAAGYLERRRVGRRNAYALRLDTPMRHPVEAYVPVRALVESVLAP